MAVPVDEGPQIVSLTGDNRGWADESRDQWFVPDHVRGKELLLQILTAEAEKAGDGSERPFLTFNNDHRRLGLSRENRLVLAALFGTPRHSLGQWITITAGVNSMKTPVVKILNRPTVPPPTCSECGVELNSDEATAGTCEGCKPAGKPKSKRTKRAS